MTKKYNNYDWCLTIFCKLQGQLYGMNACMHFFCVIVVNYTTAEKLASSW